MSTATATVPNSLKSLASLRKKGAIATVTRLGDGRSFTGVLFLDDSGMVTVRTPGRRGRPAKMDRRMIASITLAETEAAQELVDAV